MSIVDTMTHKLQARKAPIDRPDVLESELNAAHEQFQAQVADIAVRRDERRSQIDREAAALRHELAALADEDSRLVNLPV